jgi:sugar phosphate isomerase/epimerase
MSDPMSERPLNRRRILQAGAVGVAAAFVPSAYADDPTKKPLPGGDPWRGLKIGVASYTFRNFPVETTIKGIRRVGLPWVSIKDSHLPMKSSAEERKAVGRQFRDAGITPLSCGVVYLPKDEAGIRAAFEYARDLGVPTMVCSPTPGTFDLLDRLVEEFDIRLAIHNHGPGDKNFPTPDDVMKAAQDHDKRIGLCIDIGHTLRSGVDPAKAILKHRERLFDIHLKDETRAAANGAPVEAGRGALDLKAVFHALLRIRYPYMAEFEYEKDGDDPLPGLSESVGYCKGLIA